MISGGGGSIWHGRGQISDPTRYPCDEAMVGVAAADCGWSGGIGAIAAGAGAEWKRRRRSNPSGGQWQRRLLRVIHGVMCPHSNQWATFF